MSSPVGPRIRGQDRYAGLAGARQWRIDNKPYFDALYGPEVHRTPCKACCGTGFTTALVEERANG